MSAYRRDKWRQYAGDEPDPGSSEDEAYAAVDAKVAYTRQSVQERAEKWDAIEALKPTKRPRRPRRPYILQSTAVFVRPCALSRAPKALVSFVCKPRDGGKSEIGGTRVSVVAGEEHDEKWKQVLSREVLDMRRGERIEADIDDQLKLDCCLHAVRVSRQLAPVDAEIYKGHGTVSSKRMEAPKPGGIRPKFYGSAEPSTARHRRGACSMAWRCRFLTARQAPDVATMIAMMMLYSRLPRASTRKILNWARATSARAWRSLC